MEKPLPRISSRMVSVSEARQNKDNTAQTGGSHFHKRHERTFVFAQGVRLNHRKCLLLREEEADLSVGLFLTGAAVQLIDGMVLYSKLRS